MIDFKNVTKEYEDRVVLSNATLHIDDGEFVFIMGPTGAGKSTLIKLLFREIESEDGEIIVDGRDLDDLSQREIPAYRRNIGMVFQDFRLLPNLTVYENVAFAMEIFHKRRKEIKDKVPRLLRVVGIEDLADNFPDQISGGEQQRVAIARALANNPKYIIADEPTGNLDPNTAWAIMDLLNEINKRGTTVIMVTHAKEIVEKMNKRIISIQDGRIVYDTGVLSFNNFKADLTDICLTDKTITAVKNAEELMQSVGNDIPERPTGPVCATGPVPTILEAMEAPAPEFTEGDGHHIRYTFEMEYTSHDLEPIKDTEPSEIQPSELEPSDPGFPEFESSELEQDFTTEEPTIDLEEVKASLEAENV